MIERIIGASARNLMLVLIGTAFAVFAGIYAVLHLQACPGHRVIVFAHSQEAAE